MNGFCQAVKMGPSEFNILNADNNDVDTEEVSNDLVVCDTSKFRRLYVRGLPLTITENDVRMYFSKWGEVDECLLTKHATTLLCYLTFVFPTSVDAVQANRPHKLGHADVETRRILPENRPFKKLYVGGLKGGTTTGHVFAGFSRFGRVRAVDMIKDKHTGRCRGFCFVTFDDYDSADKCTLNLPIVLHNKIVRIQKAVPVSEMIKLTEERENNKITNPSGVFQKETRNSTSSTDSGVCLENSIPEKSFDPSRRRDYSTGQNQFDFSNKSKRFLFPSYNTLHANDTGFNFYPTLQPDPCYPSSFLPNQMVTPMNVDPNYLVSYSNKHALGGMQCPIYRDSFVPNSIPLNFSYNVASPNLSNPNAGFSFEFKNNQNVHRSQIPTVPMLHPVPMMCNLPSPGFVCPYPNTFT